MEISRWTPEERVSGLVARAEFRGLAVVERFQIVQDVLRKGLGERAEDVGLIFVFTPEEFVDYDEDRRSA